MCLPHGAKTILKTAELKPGKSPRNFQFPSVKTGKARGPLIKLERQRRRPPLDFDHLIRSFLRVFPDGFEGQEFEERERGYKSKAATVLKDMLGRRNFERLLRDGAHVEACEIAKRVMRSTNLVHPIEKAKFVGGIENSTNQQRFATALYDLLWGGGEMEERFTMYCGLLSEMGANKWPIATYYQFLATDGHIGMFKRWTLGEQ